MKGTTCLLTLTSLPPRLADCDSQSAKARLTHSSCTPSLALAEKRSSNTMTSKARRQLKFPLLAALILSLVPLACAGEETSSAQLNCDEVIDTVASSAELGEDYVIFGDALALPMIEGSRHAFNQDGYLRSKVHLQLKANTPVTISAGENVTALNYSWERNYVDSYTTEGCQGPEGTWYAFSGAVAVDEPACATVQVETPAGKETHQLPIGKACS